MEFPLISRLAKSANIYRTREEYFQKTGKTAPDFDWSRPAKNWEDSRTFGDPEEEIEYLGVVYDGNGRPIEETPGIVKTKRFKLYPEIATTVNLIPSPFPPDSVLTMAQRAMAKRVIPEPLELLEGEKVMLGANGLVVDDGKSAPVSVGSGGGFTESDRAVLQAIRKTQTEHGETLKAMVSAFLSFQQPAQK